MARKNEQSAHETTEPNDPPASLRTHDEGEDECRSSDEGADGGSCEGGNEDEPVARKHEQSAHETTELDDSMASFGILDENEDECGNNDKDRDQSPGPCEDQLERYLLDLLSAAMGRNQVRGEPQERMAGMFLGKSLENLSWRGIIRHVYKINRVMTCNCDGNKPKQTDGAMIKHALGSPIRLKMNTSTFSILAMQEKNVLVIIYWTVIMKKPTQHTKSMGASGTAS